jgi:tetratricopeptide (TPR) repeat protein
LLETGWTAKALAASEECCKQYPQDPYAHMSRAKALAADGQYQKAIQMIDFVIDYANSAHVDGLVDKYRGNLPLIQRGMYEVELGSFSRAVQDFKQGFPDKPDADDYFYRARAEIGLHLLPRGCADLQQAIDLYFDDARIVRRDQAAKLLQDTRRQMKS